jgi:hypothetical protein
MAAKTEIYTWRVSATLKSKLEDAAREQQRSVAQLLDEIVTERLQNADRKAYADDEAQRRLHDQVRPLLGSISGDGSRRSERVRELVREKLKGRRSRALQRPR